MRSDERAGRTGGRLAGLDLLRGIAALGVLSVHLPWPKQIPAPFPRGYLAVDLFFVLSGFVLAHAYSDRLGTRQQFGQYCLARLIRLYPLYCVATLIGAAEVLAFLVFGHGQNGNITPDRLVASSATALLFLPTPPGWSVAPVSLFPLVFPAWSLLWELLVNLLFGLGRTSRRTPRLLLFASLGAVSLAASLWVYGSVTVGEGWSGALTGGAQALFCFFAGCLLFQLRRRYAPPAVPVLLLALVLLLSFLPATWGGAAYDLACMALVYPLLVWLGGGAAMGPRVRAAGDFLGYLSYPVYVLQAPLLLWLAPVSVRIERVAPGGRAIGLVLDVIVILAGSWLLARSFDSRVREWLRSRLIPRAHVPRAQSAP